MIALFATPIFLWDFTVSESGVIESGATQQWAWEVPAAGPASVEPLWGTKPSGLYLHDSADAIEVPLPDLSSLSEPLLVVEHWFDVETGDAGVFELDVGGGFTRAESLYGYPAVEGVVGVSGGFVVDAVDLAGLPPSTRFRMLFASDGALAATGWYVRSVELLDGDALPPRLEVLTAPSDTRDTDGPYVVEVEVRDDRGVAGVTGWWSANGSNFAPVVGVASGGIYRVELPGQGSDTVVEWFVEATDTDGKTATAPASPGSFVVSLPAPSNLRSELESPRNVAQLLPLAWDEPDAEDPVLHYILDHEGAQPVEVGTPHAIVDLQPEDSQLFRVTAVYAAGPSSPSSPLQLSVEVPTLRSVEPSEGFPGERMFVEVHGDSVYFSEPASISLGSGVSVEEVVLVDINRLSLQVAVAASAAPGTRTLTVGGWTFPDAFEVLNGEAPSIVSIEPTEIEQGEEVEVRVVATQPFTASVSVDLPSDLVLQSAPVVQGKEATFRLAAAASARLGSAGIVLIDDVRHWETEITITEYVIPPQRSCSTSGTEGALWLGALVGLIRRKHFL